MLPSSSLPSGRTGNILLSVCLFFLFLLYFVFGAGWYEPTKLVLRGQASSGSSLIKVHWDSGAGFNDYEQRLFQPNIQPIDGQVNISIGSTGRSLNQEVVCEAVLVDGKEIDLNTIAAEPLRTQSGLRFKDAENISFRIHATSHIVFRFRTDTSSGIAFVSVNGTRTEHDLHMDNVEAKFKQLDYWLLHQPDSSFTVETNLPRYVVHVLEIINGNVASSVRLTSAELHGKGKVVDLLHGQPIELSSIRFSNVLDRMYSYFHPLQFVQQILFALFSVWLLTALLRLYSRLGGLRGCVLAQGRQWFWVMLLGSLTVFGTWLAAFWPGVMSVDSMKIWRAASLPDMYINDHPLLNVILYKYLRHFWNNVALVPITQVFLTSLLIAWFGFWLYRQGVSKSILLLWLLFILCSIPVGLYNVVLWKDIPFALLVVFWACSLVKLWHEKQQNQLSWTVERSCALILLGLSLGLIRHNGLIYFAVLPMLLLVLGLVPLKKTMFTLAVLLLAAGIGFAMLQHITPEAGFFTQTIRWYASTVKLENAGQDAKRTMREYLTVLDIEAPQVDKFHYYLQDRHAWWFLFHSGWWDVYPYRHEQARIPALNKLAMQFYEQSYQKPWIWLTWNPVWLLALLPLLTLLFRWFPATAVLGTMLMAGTLPLVYLHILNWRYYYFLYFGLLFLPAFISLDFACRRSKQCASPS
ncbi:hypothetical protein VU08_07270 [Desulfobulbus sp. F5]|nr:hypothetical protein [Desulfobulbus sp. F5]